MIAFFMELLNLKVVLRCSVEKFDFVYFCFEEPGQSDKLRGGCDNVGVHESLWFFEYDIITLKTDLE